MLSLQFFTYIEHDSFDGHVLLNKSSMYSLYLNSYLYILYALFIELMGFFYSSQILQKRMMSFSSQWPEWFPSSFLVASQKRECCLWSTNKWLLAVFRLFSLAFFQSVVGRQLFGNWTWSHGFLWVHACRPSSSKLHSLEGSLNFHRNLLKPVCVMKQLAHNMTTKDDTILCPLYFCVSAFPWTLNRCGHLCALQGQEE